MRMMNIIDEALDAFDDVARVMAALRVVVY
jgi:hypothetical protein